MELEIRDIVMGGVVLGTVVLGTMGLVLGGLYCAYDLDRREIESRSKKGD